jgi:hypothetical protein
MLVGITQSLAESGGYSAKAPHPVSNVPFVEDNGGAVRTETKPAAPAELPQQKKTDQIDAQRSPPPDKSANIEPPKEKKWWEIQIGRAHV